MQFLHVIPGAAFLQRTILGGKKQTLGFCIRFAGGFQTKILLEGLNRRSSSCIINAGCITDQIIEILQAILKGGYIVPFIPFLQIPILRYGDFKPVIIQVIHRDSLFFTDCPQGQKEKQNRQQCQ